MCVSDWRAGRFMRTAVKGVSIVNVSPGTVTANRQRVGVRLSMTIQQAFAGNSFDVRVDGVSVGLVTSALAFIELTTANNGDMPTREITMQTLDAVAFDVQVAEVFMTEEFLNAGTEQWKTSLLGGQR